MDDQESIAWCLECLAEAAGGEGDAARAARLLGAAEALREAIDCPMWPGDRADYERHVGTLRTALGESALSAAWTEGRAMPLEAAIAFALETADLPELGILRRAGCDRLHQRQRVDGDGPTP